MIPRASAHHLPRSNRARRGLATERTNRDQATGLPTHMRQACVCGLRALRVLEFRKLARAACDSPCDSEFVETKQLPSHEDLRAISTMEAAGIETAGRCGKINRETRPYRAPAWNHCRP